MQLPQILSDFEGQPIAITLLRQKLKELGQAAGYALKGKKNALLAHDRIRLLAQFYRACGGKGWVVFFDELERFTLFPTKQQVGAWEELGWWQEAARQVGAALLPVFAVTSGLAEHAIEVDEPRFRSSGLDSGGADPDHSGTLGIQLVRNPTRLNSPDRDQEEQIKYRVKGIYEAAYGVRVPARELDRGDVRTSIRSEIRRWITLWDLHRCYPDYDPTLVSEEMTFDTSEITDESVFADDDDSAATA